MLKMASQLETIVNAYKTISKIPSIAGGKLNKAGNKVTAKWSVRNIDKGKSTKYTTNYILDDSLNVIAESEYPIDISNELLSAISPQETYKAIIREEKNGKDPKKQYLEVWKKATLAHCIDLTAMDMHGDVYADSEFGSLGWSPDESAIVYVAEKKPPKTEPYIKRKGEDKSKNEGTGDKPSPKKGEEFVYKQDWGEQLVGKISSVIVVCQLQHETLTVLDRVPEDCCPGQVRFSADGAYVVGAAWETEPRRLGLIYCTNRPGVIFSVTLDGMMTEYSKPGLAVRSPRCSARGCLVWLQRAAGGAHHACHQLVGMRQDSDKREVVTIIDIVQRETKTANGEPFHGVYCQSLPARCFSDDERRVVFSTPQRNEVRSYVVDIETGSLNDISIKTPGSTSILDVQGDVILASHSSLTTPGQLYVARLPAKGSEADIKWVRVSEPLAVPDCVAAATVEYLQLEHKDSSDDVKSFSAIYLGPKPEEGKKHPLIVWPHGGPHSNFVNGFALETALFNMLGFSAILINYRGSTGAGQSSIDFLPGRCGDADVKDCRMATDAALAKFNVDVRQVVLCGGSHGGFLVTHLSGQYPDVYSAVVSRNPVTDVATMYNYTDINDCYGGLVVAHLAAKCPDSFRAVVMRNPLTDLATKGHCADNSDGCAVEAGIEFTEKGPLSEEHLLTMRRCSPMAHVHKVRAPTAVMLGSGDRRVPHYQGLEYARRLKANGVETRVYMYDDNHSLSSLPAEMDNLINGASWFLAHLDRE